jgi:very-short-patch-repair endonuclease
MALISEIVHSLGGMAQKQQLVRRGARDHDLTRAVRSGDVVRVRNGWYSTLPETSLPLRAVRVGGRLTGISAIEAAGGWVLAEHPLHVAVNDNAARLRAQYNRHERFAPGSPRGVMLHWEPREQRNTGTSVSVALVDALERVVLDEDFEVAIAALDWALRMQQIDVIDFERLILRLPRERREIRDWVDERCDSLPESLARTRLRLAGHAVVSQMPMTGGRAIDLVVDDVVAMETDGEEFHANRFLADRHKDLDMTIMGYHPLRAAARSVFSDWAHVEAAIDMAIAARGVASRRIGNSGTTSRHPFSSRGLRGWRRRPPRRSPEFSHETEVRWGGGVRFRE